MKHNVALVNVGSASPVLASIHSVLVSISCWRDCVHIAYTAPMPHTCWPASYTMAWHRTNASYTVSTGSTPRICWAAGLAVHTAGGEYKPTQTQCLLNAGAASPMLASIYSFLVSTSCWRDWPGNGLASD